jgi:adenine-specific DNA methylase
LAIPEAQLSTDRQDERPLSFGIASVPDLFTDRQLAVLGTAFQWVADADLEPRLRVGLRLALSNALATNNKLCSYASDYGRLSALFSVRGYSLPALAVELNPLHPDGGRGTFPHCIERVARAGTTLVRRYSWNPTRRVAEPSTVTLTTAAQIDDVTCTAASVPPEPSAPPADLCIFDPPYFDYIAYAELSEFYRAWLPGADVRGAPLLPSGDDPAEGFGLELGLSLRASLARLAPGRPIAFTYHGTNPDAWRAVGIALDEAKLRVTGLWPIRSDGHMGLGHHSHPGNCEWDLVVVCRRVAETAPASCGLTADTWVRAARPLSIGRADKISMKLAISIASTRYGELAKEPNT